MFGRRQIEARQQRRAGEKAAHLSALVDGSRGMHSGTYAGGTAGPAPKEAAVRSEEYRRLVAALPCKHCGIHGYSQAAHPNTGKGGAIKTDDRECFPLCTVHPVAGGFVQGCHERFDQGALYDKAARRLIEPAWGADTRRQIKAAGDWPKGLPEWDKE